MPLMSSSSTVSPVMAPIWVQASVRSTTMQSAGMPFLTDSKALSTLARDFLTRSTWRRLVRKSSLPASASW